MCPDLLLQNLFKFDQTAASAVFQAGLAFLSSLVDCAHLHLQLIATPKFVCLQRVFGTHLCSVIPNIDEKTAHSCLYGYLSAEDSLISGQIILPLALSSSRTPLLFGTLTIAAAR